MNEYYVCELSMLENGVITPYTVNGIKIVVVKFGEEVKAFQAFCPHEGFPLARFGKIEDNVLTCFHQGIEFCTETGKYLKKAPKCPNLMIYDVIIDDNVVAIIIPAETTVKI